MLPCIYGRATLAMVESSVCMNIASMAEAVIRPRYGTRMESDIVPWTSASWRIVRLSARSRYLPGAAASFSSGSAISANS